MAAWKTKSKVIWVKHEKWKFLHKQVSFYITRKPQLSNSCVTAVMTDSEL
jgi:hypothetical protein